MKFTPFNVKEKNIGMFIDEEFSDYPDKEYMQTFLSRAHKLFTIENFGKTIGWLTIKYFEKKKIFLTTLFLAKEIDQKNIKIFADFLNKKREKLNDCEKISIYSFYKSKNILEYFEAEIISYRFLKEKIDTSFWITNNLPYGHQISYKCEDYSTLENFYFKVFQESGSPLPLETIISFIKNFRNNTEEKSELLYKIDDVLVGVALCHLTKSNRNYLYLLGVDKKYRGKGIGKKLLTEYEKTYPNLSQIITTQNTHPNAMILYQSFGYKIEKIESITCDFLIIKK